MFTGSMDNMGGTFAELEFCKGSFFGAGLEPVSEMDEEGALGCLH